MINEKDELLEQIRKSLNPDVRYVLSALCRYMRKNFAFDWAYEGDYNKNGDMAEDIEWLEDNLTKEKELEK